MTPRATYRLQFHKDFGFSGAARLAPYLSKLGVSHVYCSPWLKARPGSTHGYDIVDHHSLNPELGTQEDFDGMIAAFRANGLRSLLDFVPNHMGVGGSDNPLWLDVLEWGPDSTYAGWFDIDWQEGKLLVPLLGDQYGKVLYAGKLDLRFDEQDGSFAIWAYDTHKLPICPLHYGRILDARHPQLERLGDAFVNLPEWRPQIGRRAWDLKAELAQAARDDSTVRDAVLAAVARFDGIPGNEESWGALRELIAGQHWRAADFRVAANDINYRRFFNINELAGMRMELPEVFEHAHVLVTRLLRDGIIDGLRIDHVDGLLNPKEYFHRVRALGDHCYLVVEKILARHESLREDWEVDGTTGYEFTNQVLGLLIDPAGEEGFDRTYASFTGQRQTFSEIMRDGKLRIMRNEMAGELDVLAREAQRVARQNPKTADFTQTVLRRAIREIVACFPVYRTYVDWDGTPSEEDRRYLSWAVKQARATGAEIDSTVYDFLHDLLTGDLVSQSHSGFSRYAVLRCAMKFQQYSGPVMAKGLEDTALYRYNRFVALNEVGGVPDQFGTPVSAFHKANAHRARHWPKSMVTTSTHDTKRGEDVRARLAVLSEAPQEWSSQVETWSRILRARSGDIQAAAPPSRNDEYLFYQMLLGSWPFELLESLDADGLRIYGDRLKGALLKSMREAKVQTTWAAPDHTYESAVLAFVDRALDTEGSQAFFSTFLPFAQKIAKMGVQNSLIQTALKLTVPGVPDLYQGSELWDLSFVDPDNRRPIDFEQRICLLSRVDETPDKLFLTAKILELRAAVPDLFLQGSYEPILATGAKADCICAFARTHGERSVVVLAARFPVRRDADPDWAGTTIPLPAAHYRDVLSGAEFGGEIQAAAAFSKMPVAILLS